MPMTHAGGNVPIRAVFGGLTDVGHKREHNEDHILVRVDLGLFILADGMGGHNAGDVASKLATSSLVSFFEATRGQTYFGIPPEGYDHLDVDGLRLLFGIIKAPFRVLGKGRCLIQRPVRRVEIRPTSRETEPFISATSVIVDVTGSPMGRLNNSRTTIRSSTMFFAQNPIWIRSNWLIFPRTSSPAL